MPSAILAVKIIGDASRAKKALAETDDAVGKTASRMSKFNDGMRKAKAPAAAVAGGLLLMAKQGFDAASALEQSDGAIQAVFGSHASGMQALASRASQNVGLAKSEYQDLATIIGSQLKTMGVSMNDLGPQTDKLISLGADLAAQFGGSTADAVSALSSLMRGERDPIERYGVSIKAADVEAKKAAMGLSGLTGEAAKAADTQATLALLTEQTASAQGAFGREADTAAGQQQRATAAAKDAAANLGQVLLPVVASASQHLATFALWVQRNSDVLVPLILVVGGLAAAVLAYNAIMGAVPAITALVTAAQWAWNAAMAANPLGLIVLGIAAVVVAIVLLVRHWAAVKRAALATWQAVTAPARQAGSLVAGVARGIGGAFAGAWTQVTAGANRAGSWLAGTARGIGGAFAGAGRSVTSSWGSAVNWVVGRAGAITARVTGVGSSIANAFRSGTTQAGSYFANLYWAVVGWVRSIFDWLASIPGRIRNAFHVEPPGWMSKAAGILGFAAPPAGMPGDPLALTAATTWATTPAWPSPTGPRPATPAPNVAVNITIQGALDPRAVAKQIRDILNTDARLSGRVQLTNKVV